MLSKVNNGIFSKLFLLMMGVVYFLNYIYSNTLPKLLSLTPIDVVKDLSLWKLVTFPFTPSGIESVVFFGIVFYFISSKLEVYIEGLRYSLWLFLLTLLQGCILTLVFINSKVIISGMDGISFYILIIYSLLRSKDKILFLNFPSMPIIAFSLLIVFMWFGLKLVNFSTMGNESDFMAAIGSSLFGITAGLIHFLQIRLSSTIIGKNNKDKGDSDIKMPTPEELSIAHNSNTRIRKFYQQQSNDFNQSYADVLSEDMEENEEKLNEILDKINSLGKESLSNYDKKFLEEYSKKL